MGSGIRAPEDGFQLRLFGRAQVRPTGALGAVFRGYPEHFTANQSRAPANIGLFHPRDKSESKNVRLSHLRGSSPDRDKASQRLLLQKYLLKNLLLKNLLKH